MSYKIRRDNLQDVQCRDSNKAHVKNKVPTKKHHHSLLTYSPQRNKFPIKMQNNNLKKIQWRKTECIWKNWGKSVIWIKMQEDRNYLK